jgi:hypothetical protein
MVTQSKTLQSGVQIGLCLKENEMIKLVDILKESKQVGPLYHWTDIYSSYNIINDNFLKGYLTDTFTSQPAISFTRNKNFLQTKPKLRNRPEICFVIDGDKLSNKYKIQPFQDPKIKKDEMEEKVLTDGIDNFSNYITKIIIPKKRFSPGKSTYDYSPDQYERKFKEVGGKGWYRDVKNYTNWLIDKGFNNFEVI